MSSANPLPPCPGTPNCERESHSFPGSSPEALFERAQDVLGDMGPVELTIRSDERRVDAVFRVALVFKDDVAVAVTPRDDGGTALHIRSASRVGHGDLGVNRRRVQRFLSLLTAGSDR